MTLEAGNVNANISANTQKFEGGIETAKKKLDSFAEGAKQTAKKLKDLGKDIADFGKEMTTSITLPITGAGAAVVKFASDAEEMRGKFKVVFGELEDDVRSWAATQAAAMNRSQIDIENYLANSQNMLVGMGMTREAGAELSKQIVQMGIDLASFNNLSESDALGNLESALVGNHMAARSLGAVLNENTLALAMQQMGLKGTFQELSENEKIQVRFRAIVMQSTDAIGDAERTSGSFANQLRGLKGRAKDVAVEFGDILLPQATSLIEKLSAGVEWVRNLDEDKKKLIIRVAAVAAAIGPLILVMGTMVKVAGTAVSVVTALSSAKAYLASKGIPNLSKALNFLAANPIVAVSLAVSVLIQGIRHLYDTNENFRHFVQDAWYKIKMYVLENVRDALEGLEKFAGWIPGLGKKIFEFKEEVSNMIDDQEVKRRLQIAIRESEKMADTAGTVKKSADGASGALAGYANASNMAAGKAEKQAKATKEQAKELSELEKQLTRLDIEWARYNEGQGKNASESEKLAVHKEILKQKLTAVEEETKKVREQFLLATDSQNYNLEAAKDLAEQLEKLKKIQEELKQAIGETNSEMRKQADFQRLLASGNSKDVQSGALLWATDAAMGGYWDFSEGYGDKAKWVSSGSGKSYDQMTNDEIAAQLANMPKFHRGRTPGTTRKEFPAIIQDDEWVIPDGEVPRLDIRQIIIDILNSLRLPVQKMALAANSPGMQNLPFEGLLPTSLTGSLGLKEIVQEVAREIAARIKPGVSLETNIYSPEPLSPSVIHRKQEQALREFALRWD
ncbi:MAG: phage tail tape measure protein [Bacillota bacterium]